MHSRENPELKAILAEASQALAGLDADRLEAMVRYCETLIGGPEGSLIDPKARAPLSAICADREFATFARVLQATRSNLRALRRIREMDEPGLEYRPEMAGCSRSGESNDGEY